ncbi:MAG TPA: flavodoxin domain-containing protein, partial [Casimicrobiaceae bacterium]|nr:flavodoxin domain-containing protein [Casimicrobiaceae bacterium]
MVRRTFGEATIKAVVILYATREGQTRRIAEHLAKMLRAHDCAVDVLDVAQDSPTAFDLARYAAAIVASPVHIGKHERSVVAFVKKHRAQLHRIPCTFLSVSLSHAGAVDPNATAERRRSAAANVQKMIAEFLRQTGWKPTRVHPVAGALLYRQYGVVIRLMMLFIARLVGTSTDTTRDHEYTDWREVEAFAAELAESVNGAARSPA